MTAPTPTARVTPDGIKIDDGHSTLVTFAADTDISFWEKSVTPPGQDGGDENDTTTMHNVTYRTRSPRKLKTLTEMQMTAAYDAKVIDQITSLINVETTVTITYPNGDTLAFFGFLKSFEPDALEEGSQPEATVTVVPTNQDPATGAEESPVFTAASGT